MVRLMAKTDYSEKSQSSQQREEVHGAKSKGARHKLPEFSLRGVTWDMLNSPSNIVECDILCECCPPGKLIRDSGPGFLLGSGHVVPFAWHIPKLQTPRRKAGVSHSVCRV